MINNHINTMMRITKQKHKNNSTTDRHSEDFSFEGSSDFLRDATTAVAISAGFIVTVLLYKHTVHDRGFSELYRHNICVPFQ